MSTLDQYVDAGADDYTTGNPANDTDTRLMVRYLTNPTEVISTGYALIDTSSIPSDAVITGATFYWYDDDYLYPKGATPQGNIWMCPSSCYLIYSFSGSFSAGPKSHALTSGELAYINKSGDTVFRFTVTIETGKNRTWFIRAYDGYSGSNEQCRLVVHYVENNHKRSIILR